eukprot:8723005-Ditylum_brightwellii.AAC.1
MEDTNGCSKQYIPASSLCLISTFSIKYGIVIDNAVGAPGHCKDVVDGLNAVDKIYLKISMLRNSIPEEDKNITNHEMSLCNTNGIRLQASFTTPC